MSAPEIAAAVESWGGELDGFSGRNSFGVSGKFLNRDMDKGLDLLADLLIHPSFPPMEIEKVRKDILTDIMSKTDNPRNQMFELFRDTLYQNHPYGRPTTGTVQSISSIGREDMVAWFGSLAVPSNLVLAVVGDVNREEVVSKVRHRFKAPGSSGFDPPKIHGNPPLQSPREVHLERDGAQVHLIIGYLGAGLKSPDNAVMTLVDTALSGQGGRDSFPN